ncbi:MAG: TrmH family RNA methyltransferase [bacterium]|nr:TrmH family RNA methyltransferase [bacterium]MDT8364994.1 TrmH family RNA methyltransferase [bacterium]
MAPSPLPSRPQDNITVILHRPAIPENIGSVARAMGNTGFSRLIISCPETEDWPTAGKLAVSAAHILDRAPRCGSLEEAIALSEARYLVGTTGRSRKYWQSTEIGTAAPQILSRSISGGTALLFGPESTGLNNEELTLCHTTVTLPFDGELASYNLAQAVLLVLFTLMTHAKPESPPASPDSASFEEVEGMYTHIQELLTEVGFLWEDNPDHMMKAVREFVNRAGPGESEVKMIRGVCRKLLYHLRNK